MTLRRAASFPLQEHLDMAVESPAPGTARATLLVTPALHNPNGVVHGAVLFAMVDTAMGSATMSCLEPGFACATIEVHVRFLRAVASGRLTADIAVIKGGRRVVQLEGRVTDEAGELIALASGSFAVIPAVREAQPG
jgi:uncharacterized protein (TIGR00369 family)